MCGIAGGGSRRQDRLDEARARGGRGRPARVLTRGALREGYFLFELYERGSIALYAI